MEIGQIVTDEELIKNLNAQSEKKKVEKEYDIKEGEIVLDQKTIEELNAQKLKKIEKKESEPTWFEKMLDVTVDAVTGDSKTEFKQMGEVYQIKTDSLAKGLALNVGWLSNANSDARLDMIMKQYPGTVLSKDKFDNIIVTLPQNTVKDGNNSFYLDKPGISVDGFVNTVGMTLMYIPGAGWVERNVAKGTIAKVVAHGGSAMATGGASDVISYTLGSKQGEGMIPILEEDKALINLVAGAGGEKVGQFLKTWSGFNAVKNVVKNQIPSRFNIASGSGLYFDNKGTVTNATIKLAKEYGANDKVLANKTLMVDFAKALESGLDKTTAGNMVGLNEFGISIWLAQASGNKKVLNKIQLMRDGAYGDDIQKIIQAQDDKQLKQVFEYLGKYRSKLLNQKNSVDQIPPNMKNEVGKNVDENIKQVEQLIKETEEKMYNSVQAKYSAVDKNAKLSFKKPVLKNFTYHINKALLDADDGIGQVLNKELMPQSSVVMKSLNKFMSSLENKNLSKITVGMLETERKKIVKMMSNMPNGVDKSALMVIKKRFDVFYDDAIEKGLTSGSKDVLDAVKKARAANTEFMKTFSVSNITKKGVKQIDSGGKFVRNVIDGDYTSTEIANFVYGNSASGKAWQDKSVKVINKLHDIFKPNTEGRQLIKDGAYLRIIQNSFKKQGSREVFDPIQFVKATNEAFNGSGKNVSKLLFTPQEQKQLLAFAKEIESKIPRKTFVNADEGANAFMGIWNSFARSAVGIAGFQTFGIQGTISGRFLYDSVAKNNVKVQQLKEIEEAIFKLGIPESSGGAGVVDQAIEKRPILKNAEENVTYNEKVIPNASALEGYGVIKSLDRYR